MGALWALFFSFLQIGMLSFGGGYATIPLIQEYVVEGRGWLSMQAFTDVITISQMTPGPLAVNTSTFVGLKIAGLPGAVIATLGCVLCGFLISVSLYLFFQRHQESKYIMGVLTGLRAAAVGLIGSAASAILLLAFFGVSTLSEVAGAVNLRAVGIFAVVLFLIRKFKINPLYLMALSGVAGYFLYR